MTELEKQEQQDILSAFEKGHRLNQTRSTAGWQDVLDIIEDEVVKWEFRLLNTKSGASTSYLRDVRAEAKVARAMLERIQLRVDAAIADSVKLVEQTTPVINYQNTNL